jgi:hypothetical protein
MVKAHLAALAVIIASAQGFSLTAIPSSAQSSRHGVDSAIKLRMTDKVMVSRGSMWRNV